MKITKGETAPEFTLRDQYGKDWTLAEQRGAPLVLYFYPKDDTPGCTNQACDIRDHWAEFSDLGVAVVGISPDDVASHDKFVAKFDLPHTLLADPDRVAINAYGAWGNKSMYGKVYQGVVRCSVVIAADGTVAEVFDKIQPKQQSKKSLTVVRDLLA